MQAIGNRGAFSTASEAVSEEPVTAQQTGDLAAELSAMTPRFTPPVLPPIDGPQVQAGGLSRMRRAAKPEAVPASVEPVAAPKGSFQPGVRPEPTGPTARALWSNTESRSKLAHAIGEWEKANPGRKLKAPDIVAAWNAGNPDAPLNEARARTLGRLISKAKEDFLLDSVHGYMSRGAKKALGVA